MMLKPTFKNLLDNHLVDLKKLLKNLHLSKTREGQGAVALIGVANRTSH
jgi:hypothetical protein